MEQQRVFRYRAKRDVYFNMRLVKESEELGIDVEVEGIPPHHFDPLDGGPVGECKDSSIFARHDARIQARKRANEDATEPRTLHEMARTSSASISEPDKPFPRNEREPAPTLSEGATFDDYMDLGKPALIEMARKEGKSTRGSKGDLARRLLGVE